MTTYYQKNPIIMVLVTTAELWTPEDWQEGEVLPLVVETFVLITSHLLLSHLFLKKDYKQLNFSPNSHLLCLKII